MIRFIRVEYDPEIYAEAHAALSADDSIQVEDLRSVKALPCLVYKPIAPEDDVDAIASKYFPTASGYVAVHVEKIRFSETAIKGAEGTLELPFRVVSDSVVYDEEEDVFTPVDPHGEWGQDLEPGEVVIHPHTREAYFLVPATEGSHEWSSCLREGPPDPRGDKIYSPTQLELLKEGKNPEPLRPIKLPGPGPRRMARAVPT
jgi:hypothetical protein